MKKIKNLEKLTEDLLAKKGVTYGMKRALRCLKKEISLYKNHINGSNFKRINPSRKKIQIGGGSHTLKGFLNIDIISPADLIYDVREGLPLTDSSIDFIFCEHFLEHIDYPVSVKEFVKECLRILKEDGQLVIGVPDGELIMKKYIEKDKEFFTEMIKRWYGNRDCLEHFNTYIDLVNYHFRDQKDSQKYTPHLWTYDFEKLKSLLENVGFSGVSRWTFNPEIANPKRKWASIYVVGKK